MAISEQLEKIFDANVNSRTTAEEQTAALNKQSQAAYQEQRIANQEAQNQFVQNQAANQLSALDAIRRSNASAIANGANTGLSAANQLSTILGLQEESAQAATDLANQNIESAAAYNTALNENAAKGQELANQLNATLDANAAELAKSIATEESTQVADQQRQDEKEEANLKHFIDFLNAVKTADWAKDNPEVQANLEAMVQQYGSAVFPDYKTKEVMEAEKQAEEAKKQAEKEAKEKADKEAKEKADKERAELIAHYEALEKERPKGGISGLARDILLRQWDAEHGYDPLWRIKYGG